MPEFKPIGYVEAAQQYKYQQPRQGEYARNVGKVILETGQNYEQGLEDLVGFNKVWLIYQFHQNEGWRPKVDPPVCPDGHKKGVFSTRSPYRPNSIGLSCVDLISVQGRVLNIANFDLLDGTPVLDIKPYVFHYDSYPEASCGWVPRILPKENLILFSPQAESEAKWILEKDGPDFFDLARVQLSVDPLNEKRKRVSLQENSKAVLAYRTWRLLFEFREEEEEIEIISIYSGYSLNDLDPDAEDKYEDKELHRQFISKFGSPISKKPKGRN